MPKKALLIGINYIGMQGELNGCINDIIHAKNFLMTYHGYKEEEIVMLSEVSKNKKPTKSNIIHWMNWLVKDNTSDSQLYLHYSGHGAYTRDRNGDENDGKDETIVPLDYTKTGQITDDELKTILVEPLVKGAKMMCVFDCCHSGTVLDLHCNYKVDSNVNTNTFTINVDKHYKPSNGDVILISGCLDSQTSMDSFEAGKSQGALTYCLLEVYKLYQTKKKPVSYKALMKNLTVLMKQKQYEQIPQFSASHWIDFNANVQL